MLAGTKSIKNDKKKNLTIQSKNQGTGKKTSSKHDPIGSSSMGSAEAKENVGL